MIPVYKPYISPKSLEYATQAIKSTWISSQGEFLDRAADHLRELLGVKHVILVNNGTAATHLVALSVRAKYNFEPTIIAPNNVYVAAWNAFLYDHHKIRMIDASLDTWNFNQDSVFDETLKCKNPVILVVHNIGNVVNVPELKRRCSEVPIVEDNCEGFLGKYEGKYTGTDCLASSVSFFGNKNVTCGEGGAVITNDKSIYEYLWNLRGQGQGPQKFVHPIMGYNYRMTNVQAAILLGQLEHLDEILEQKRRVFERYRSRLGDEKIILQKTDEGTEPSNWMFGVRLKGNPWYLSTKNWLTRRGIDSRPMFWPATCHTYLRKSPDVTHSPEVNSVWLAKECVILPSYPELADDEIDTICSAVEDFSKAKCSSITV